MPSQPSEQLTPGPETTLWRLVKERAKASPDVTALIEAGRTPEEDRRIAFGALPARAERVAAGLHRLGIGPGSRVAWQLPTRIDTAVLSLALARLGAVQSPVIPGYRDREVGHILREFRAEYHVAHGESKGFDHTAMAHRLAAGLAPAPRVLEFPNGLPEAVPGELPPPPADAAENRWVYWTSGTTSAPKGVLHTDRTLISGGRCLADALRATGADVGSMAFPYAHIAGPDYFVMQLLRGFPAVMFERFAMPEALDGYRRHRVSIAGGSTAFYQMFLTEQRRQPGRRLLPDLRLLAGGGAPKPPELYRAVVRELGCGLCHGYGMTEAPMITMNSPDDTEENLAGTEGRPAADMEIRIVDPDGRPLPPGTEGDVRLRGDAVCRGYLDPGQTAESFDRDGFLITGDVGRLTPSGHLVLTGRRKDIIIRKGENISAKEIEDLLAQHPAIAEAAVIGLPDPERGERVCAVLEPAAGAALPDLAELTGFLKDRQLAVYKLPEQVEVVDRLPRNETLGKVLKTELRKRFQD
ncbi:class I adenylate-forming enzyme family protein [Phaeacidiphilus oryzae]|uniref:class I adenylate-forming enzyme family protein n=1 Tax=Phaeacidiphilus oryzae TaxID=348818 RepID=UPI00068D3DB2|nr:AMP-binding protein [Phaeacidiphilus oryzae]